MIRTRAAKTNTAKWYNSGSAIVNRTIPTLYHDFANQRYYDTALGETAFPYTSVHRSTNAMQFDANGNLVWAPANMCTRSNEMLSWALNGTATTTGGQVSYNGAATAFLIGRSTDASAAYIQTASDISKPTAALIVSGSVKLKRGTSRYGAVRIQGSFPARADITVDLDNFNVSNSALNTFTGLTTSVTNIGNGYCMLVFRVTTDTHNIVRLMISPQNISTGLIDGSSGTLAGDNIFATEVQFNLGEYRNYYPAVGASGWYGPRFDYDPVTHEPLGILVEQSRSNDISQGFNLSSSVGTFQDGTGSNGPSYLGGWSSARYTGNSVSAPHLYFTGAVTPGASTSRSVSAIVAYVDTQYLQLATSANWVLDSANTYMNIDAIAGIITASGSAVTDTFIKKLADDVYHIGFTCVTNAAPTGGAGAIVAAINTSTAGRLPSYSHTSSFDVIYLFNGAGVGWNSITPTFGTAATRAADVATMPIGSWFNQAEGVIYMETVPTSSAGTAKRAICINDGTANNAMSLIKSGSSLAQIRTVIGGVSSFSPTTANAVVDFQNTKFAALLNSPTKKIVLNGGAVASSSVAFPTSGYTTLNTGSEPSSTGYWGGWIKQIRYYNTASPSDAQLQTLTT